MFDKQIAEIHDRIFEHLLEWHRSSQENELNRYFYIRTRNDERFNKGYWFPGDNHYLALSFWAGGDSLNKTQNIYLNLDYDKDIAIILTGRDSEYKQGYFQDLANYLGGFKQRGDGLWSRPLTRFSENYLEVIDTFISREKYVIDKYIKNTLDSSHSGRNVVEMDEYSSPFGFIESKTFDKHCARVLQQKARRNRDIIPDTVAAQATTTTTTAPAATSLPIAIESVEISDFRGIKSTGNVKLSTNANWIFVTGENGYGKSSFLQALALGITNYNENKEYLKTGKVNSYYIKDNQVNYVSTYSREEGEILLDKYFIGYGPIRLIPQPESAENADASNSTNIYNLFYPTGLLKSLKFLLQNSKLTSDAEFNKIKDVLTTVLDKKIVDVKYDPARSDFTFTERLDNGDTIEGMTYNELASGFKNTLNLVGDIIDRFSKSQPNVPFNDFIGVIVIDELENHLHPKMQKDLPGLLSKAFPKIQFIATTHSPIPLLGAPKNSKFIRIDRSLEEGITAQPIELEVDISKLLPDSILSSPIFGFDEIFSNQLDDISELNTADSYEEAEIIEDLKRKFLKIKTTDKPQ